MWFALITVLCDQNLRYLKLNIWAQLKCSLSVPWTMLALALIRANLSTHKGDKLLALTYSRLRHLMGLTRR